MACWALLAICWCCEAVACRSSETIAVASAFQQLLLLALQWLAHLGCRLQISSTSLLMNIGSSDGWPARAAAVQANIP
jgi:hypothetical protein